MGKQTRRSMLKGAAVAASMATLAAADAVAQKPAAPEKKSYGYGANRKPGEAAPLFNAAVSYGNMLFLAGVGYHKPGTIQEATKAVLDEIEQNLKSAGSSMEKVLKVSVFLNDLKDYAGMNEAYKGRFGDMPPVRTTVAPAGGVPGNSLVEIDVIAYI
ncbi:MAG: 2-iminobutanoate/2-iminopropanoate deaminase [Acidobacteriaceae bacterium]|jgi:enamine deaminase RidA (YjgF/YER057c/UK114 family)|nr:2-iminobutanoate/2-iminopropanoate deaminase [Acidobacteriaceae bacterium]MDT7813349.1 2-iminobutanoate/2-iminopropanoate deaminase [Acidobacteriaceae bacterium]MDX6464271.1 2-iminobutanoate/2-iminopropanoate deaminase [Acidobacteriaceae bacterium]MEA2263823.1 2-iminobutanoate/2-iminopropanoate deaminase [Acidobacteriaceae bacterium]